MNAVVEILNAAGQAFVEFALPMLIQSGVLILILLAVDAVLRRRVRAVFRYWIWMLVLVKLVLPPSLVSPVSVGTWFGETLDVPSASLLELQSPVAVEPRVTESAPTISAAFSPPDLMIAEPPTPTPAVRSETPVQVANPTPFAQEPPVSLDWQGLSLVIWSLVVFALTLLLIQRALFVRGLLGQSEPANQAGLSELEDCRRRLGLRRAVALRLSPNATSPAVCGLLRPVILIPQSIAPRLQPQDLHAVLLHELAHVKRGDLWVNLIQTLLQIAYFYNPLLWLANAMIRRTREQAVDETVLVAMGETASQYPETLVNIAKLAFTRRPALSLRLIGVVESKSALTARIKHILTRPLPTTARLGLLGLLTILIIAAVLLPMAKGEAFGSLLGRDVLIRLRSPDKPGDGYRKVGATETYSRNYVVSCKNGERLAVVAELYQVGQPMLSLGSRVFANPGGRQRLSVMVTRRYLNQDRTAIVHGIEVAMGPEALRVNDIVVNTSEHFDITTRSWSAEPDIVRRERDGEPYVEFTHLLSLNVYPNVGKPHDAVQIWGPSYYPSTLHSAAYFILIRALPVSQLDHLWIESPANGRTQLPDGTLLPADASQEQRRAVADEYILNLKRTLMRDRMPLPKLAAHRYHKQGEPIWFHVTGRNSAGWKPRFDEIYHDPDVNPCFFVIDGREYASRCGFGPFDAMDSSLELQDNLYIRPADLDLPAGKHTVAYGWKDVDVVDPNDPGNPLHFARLTTDPAEFEIVEHVPADYYRPAYEEGWEDVLRGSIETSFTDDMHKYQIFGPLLVLGVHRLPFDTAFAVYVQAEGSEEQQPAGELARVAGAPRLVMGCDRNVKGLDWDSVGDRRWRIILKPSIDVAKKYPPIREFYAKEFTTDWLSFERSPTFELNRQREKRSRDSRQGYGGTIKADKPVDLDTLDNRWRGQGQAWPLPTGFELGWSPDNGGTLRIDPNSGVRLLWLPEANARLVRVAAESRLRLAELPQSRTTQIVPPKGEPTLIAVLSSEGKVHFVAVSRVNETWANLSWYEDEEATQQLRGQSDMDGSAQAYKGQGERTRIILPEVDRQPVVLDLATGELIPLPPVGPEPEKILKTLGEMDKGDILYDVDLGDRTLIFLRDARSEPPGEETGEPAVTGHLIRSVPETITVVTKEGRRYKVTILAADERGCTLKHSRIPADRGAGGDAPVEPEKTGGTLEFRIAPRSIDLDAAVIEKLKQTFSHGGGLPESDFAWFPIRMDLTGQPFAITHESGGKAYVLLWNKPPHVILASHDWGLESVYRVADANRRPAIGLTFNDKGTSLFHDLTAAHVQQNLAIVVEGTVVGMPNISAPLGRAAIITGNFTEQEIEDMMGSLRKGINRRRAQPGVAPVAQVGGGGEARIAPGTIQNVSGEVSGRVLDPEGNPAAEAQVALITSKASVTIDGGTLQPPRFSGAEKAAIVETDAEGRFRFENEPNDTFSLVAAHDVGFAMVGADAFTAEGMIRLEKWGRVEGQVAQGRWPQGDQIWMAGLPNETWLGHRREYLYDGRCDSQGRFAFSKVPPGWFEVGYLIRTGNSTSTHTSRTPVVVKSGETVKVTLGGEGRPVIGRFVPPAGYSGTVYFGEGIRSLDTERPEIPKPQNYDQMTKRQQQEWYRQWRTTPEYQAWSDAIWHDLNRRQYAFRINPDGTFRVEDVIAGKYDLTVYLERHDSDQSPPQEDLGGYRGSVEVPEIPGGRSDEPLDVGDLTLRMNEPPLKAGDAAPLFEAKTLDGRDIRLADYRGKFVLLSFWQPVSNPELDRLKALYKTYGADRLQIIGLGGNDTREEVESFVREHQIEWPEIYVGTTGNEIVKQYRLAGLPYIVLIVPGGKIVATWLRDEKLTKTVQEAIGEAGRADRVPLKLEYPDLPEPRFSAYSEEYYSTTANYRMPLAEEPPVVLVPPDVTNVARGKPVSSNSPTEPIIGDIEAVTDGDKKVMHFVEFEPLLSPRRPIYVTIDLGWEYEIHAVAWWHDFHRPSIYQDVVVRVARDPQFQDAAILYNNDFDDSLGFGKGTDPAYVETNKGWVAGANGVHGRYVRLYNSGSSRNLCSQFTEVEVYGR